MIKNLNIEVTHKFDGTTIPSEEFQTILDIVSWRRAPYFPHRGRMAWHILDSEYRMTNWTERSLKAAKMKGVGGFNPGEEARNRDPIYFKNADTPFQPTTIPLESFATYPHLGFDDDGNYKFVFGKAAPVGGILHERALAEYSCALHLLEHKVPAIVPLTVVQYGDGMTFHEKSMGAVVCISPSKYPHRLSEVQQGAAVTLGENKSKDEYYFEILKSFDENGDPASESTRVRLLGKIGAKVGATINNFSTCGLYRYSSVLNNFEYDFATKQVVLTDLDSSGFLKTLSPSMQRLQVLRDIASMVYHFLAKFANPLALGHYTLRTLLDNDPLTKLLSGYFPEAHLSMLEKISLRLWRLYIPHFMMLNKYKVQIQNEWTTERRRSYKMDHDLALIIAITSVYPIFCNSPVSKLYPDESLTTDALINRAEKFLNGRFQYFEYLMTETL